MNVTCGEIHENASTHIPVLFWFHSSGSEQSPSRGAYKMVNGNTFSRVVVISSECPCFVLDDDRLLSWSWPRGLLSEETGGARRWVPQLSRCCVEASGFSCVS